ncbi:hypothetical protein D6C76_05756 [Aureobasidium pullulans]|uniref:Uncharacterized protein n=1 Tax=Aureobasidium pullulans TaxID=5580 RepID=A0A4S8Y3X3_AURPU|nr:hypothetical protein D6D22_03182 [Aureobasidium pullulans]TIA76311.1 hypothetical protein D6C76_05756 [Aureobasidium pullulans]
MKQHLGAQQLSRYILLLKTSGVVISCCLWDDCYLKRQSWEGDVDLHLQHDSHYQKVSLSHVAAIIHINHICHPSIIRQHQQQQLGFNPLHQLNTFTPENSSTIIGLLIDAPLWKGGLVTIGGWRKAEGGKEGGDV